MRALSLWQPWASAMAIGVKLVETRGWNMAFRGPLAIHATATWQPHVVRWLRMDTSRTIRGLLEDAGVADWRTLPLGVVLCTVEVYDCRPTEELRETLDDAEMAFGDYRPGRFGIMTRNLRVLPSPVPARGAQGIWDWKQG